MKKIFVIWGFLIIAWIFKTEPDSPNYNISVKYSGTDSEVTNKRYAEKITDKNIDRSNTFPYIISKENIDDFWRSYLSNTEIHNEWIFTSRDEGSDVAIFGALKDNPQQGTVNIISIDSKNRILFVRQLLSPDEGGALSVINQPSSKDYIMNVQEESGTIYLFNFFNGFTAYKKTKNDNWKYWNS